MTRFTPRRKLFSFPVIVKMGSFLCFLASNTCARSCILRDLKVWFSRSRSAASPAPISQVVFIVFVLSKLVISFCLVANITSLHHIPQYHHSVVSYIGYHASLVILLNLELAQKAKSRRDHTRPTGSCPAKALQ